MFEICSDLIWFYFVLIEVIIKHKEQLDSVWALVKQPRTRPNAAPRGSHTTSQSPWLSAPYDLIGDHNSDASKALGQGMYIYCRHVYLHTAASAGCLSLCRVTKAFAGCPLSIVRHSPRWRRPFKWNCGKHSSVNLPLNRFLLTNNTCWLVQLVLANQWWSVVSTFTYILSCH